MASDTETLLKDKTLYVKQLSPIGRRWFTNKMLGAAAAQGSGDVLAGARALLTKAKGMVSSRLTQPRGSLSDDLKRVRTARIRARIVYGILGSYPDVFLDATSRDALLTFIVERRFRAIQRMLSYINPNSRKIVSYPEAGPLTAQVSKDTRTPQALWVGTNVLLNDPAGAPKRYPFVLTAAGKATPKDAIEKLFKKQNNSADRTRLDCPGAAMLALLDALLVAKHPDQLASALSAVNDVYVALDHPYGPFRMINGIPRGTFSGWVSSFADLGQNVDLKVLGVPRNTAGMLAIVDVNGRQEVEVTNVTRNTTLVDWQVRIASTPLIESTVTVASLARPVPVGAHLADLPLPDYHAVSDPRPDQSLFEQAFIPEYSLQTGDHIYVANHAFHRSRLPFTIWNGEHSFVLDPWAGSVGKMMITGHGVTTRSVAGVVATMLGEINTFLEIARKIVDAWLAIPAGRAPLVDLDADDETRASIGRLLLLGQPAAFVGKMRPFNLPSFKYKKGAKEKTYPGYWVMELDGTLDAGTPAETPIERKDILIFDYNPDRKNPANFPPVGGSKNPIAISRVRTLVAGGGSTKTHYAVSYLDDFAGLNFYLPLYYPDGSRKGRPVLLTFNDILDSIGSRSPERDMFVIRPRVRSDAAYLDHLRTLGAID